MVLLLVLAAAHGTYLINTRVYIYTVLYYRRLLLISPALLSTNSCAYDKAEE
jgi:hypothetical protein